MDTSSYVVAIYLVWHWSAGVLLKIHGIASREGGREGDDIHIPPQLPACLPTCNRVPFVVPDRCHDTQDR